MGCSTRNRTTPIASRDVRAAVQNRSPAIEWDRAISFPSFMNDVIKCWPLTVDELPEYSVT